MGWPLGRRQFFPIQIQFSGVKIDQHYQADNSIDSLPRPMTQLKSLICKWFIEYDNFGFKSEYFIPFDERRFSEGEVKV